MNGKLARLLLLAAFSVSSLITINAQQPASVASDLYVVSAQAGGINFVSGDVKVVSTTEHAAVKGEKMVAGDRLVTGADGRAEVLLNPGSFLRLSQNTEFEFTSTDLNDLRIKLERGTAIIEFYSVNDFTMSVSTPGPEFRLMKSGVYRIDVLNGTSKISVWKGIAAVGSLSQRVIGKGMSITVSAGRISEAKFDRDIMDAFDSWSKLRSSEVAALNARLQRNLMQRSILASSSDDWWRFNGTGFWVYDPFSRNRCFMPFGRRGSPYGHNYSQNVGSYNVPPPVAINNGGSNNNADGSNNNLGDQTPPVEMPRPGKGRTYRPDNDGDDGRGHPRDGVRNARQDQNGGINNSQPGTGGSADRNNDEPRVPRKVRDNDDRPTADERRESRREERRNEDRSSDSRREERRSEDRSSDSWSSGNSGNSGSGGGSQYTPPPAPPSNPLPQPDPPRNDSMPEKKSDPPR